VCVYLPRKIVSSADDLAPIVPFWDELVVLGDDVAGIVRRADDLRRGSHADKDRPANARAWEFGELARRRASR